MQCISAVSLFRCWHAGRTAQLLHLTAVCCRRETEADLLDVVHVLNAKQSEVIGQRKPVAVVVTTAVTQDLTRLGRWQCMFFSPKLRASWRLTAVMLVAPFSCEFVLNPETMGLGSQPSCRLWKRDVNADHLCMEARCWVDGTLHY